METLIDHVMSETSSCKMLLASSFLQMDLQTTESKVYSETCQKYAQILVPVVSTSSTPRARHDRLWAQDKSFHQIPPSIQKVVVEGCQGELQPAPNTFSERWKQQRTELRIPTIHYDPFLAYKFQNALIDISQKPPSSATSFHSSS